ncbi:MAG: hypothetical protein HOV92_18040 [Streptomyces sp.]|nr:hypothetical protein [Streptomyces sp.]
MNLLTDEEREALTPTVRFFPPADGDAVLRAANAIRYADGHRSDTTAVSRALSGALSVLKRLINVEAEYATTRAAIARLEIANARGDDYTLRDLAAELEQAGIDMKNDYDAADDLARAAESEAL